MLDDFPSAMLDAITSQQPESAWKVLEDWLLERGRPTTPPPLRHGNGVMLTPTWRLGLLTHLTLEPVSDTLVAPADLGSVLIGPLAQALTVMHIDWGSRNFSQAERSYTTPAERFEQLLQVAVTRPPPRLCALNVSLRPDATWNLTPLHRVRPASAGHLRLSGPPQGVLEQINAIARRGWKAITLRTVLSTAGEQEVARLARAHRGVRLVYEPPQSFHLSVINNNADVDHSVDAAGWGTLTTGEPVPEHLATVLRRIDLVCSTDDYPFALRRFSGVGQLLANGAPLTAPVALIAHRAVDLSFEPDPAQPPRPPPPMRLDRQRTNRFGLLMTPLPKR